MKKKRAFGWKDEERDPSKDIGAISGDEDLDEEIIDLEDIVELGFEDEDDTKPARAKEEILDADGDLDLNDLDTEVDDKEEDVLEEDLFKEFAFADEVVSKRDDKEDEDLLKGFGEDDFAGDFPEEEDDEDIPDIDSDLDLLAQEEEKDDFEKLLGMQSELKPAAKVETIPVEAAVGEVPPSTSPGEVSTEAASSGDAAVDDLIDQIESKLIQTVREVVEARLPEIVRALLHEEIENLKKEMS